MRVNAWKEARPRHSKPSNDDEQDGDESVWLELTLMATILIAGFVSGALALAELL